MKRCPECLFIFPETDTRCDFDNTPLVVVDDAEIESAASGAAAPPTAASSSAAASAATAKKKRTAATKKRSAGTKKGGRKKGAAITALVGFLVFGLAGLFVYSSLSSGGDEVAEIPPVAVMSMAPVAAPLVAPPPTVSSPDAAASSPTPLPRDGAERTATSHTRTTVAPVSTSGPGMGKKLGGKPAILLTSGGKIDVDEVWRTRYGVWYRRAGIVTLLKHNRVKAIVNQ